MELHAESHVDHGLTQAQLDWLLERFAEKGEFFIETVELPEDLGDVPCGLHGPLLGDDPVPEDECRHEVRGDREWTSRLCDRPERRVRTVSVIAGPHDDGSPCVLYTAFGGPVAPQEPGDPRCRDMDESKRFWDEHALTA
jgi:hypothetical protein